jgi:beta-glucosidase
MVVVEESIHTRLIDEMRMLFDDSSPQAGTRKWTLRLRGQLVPREKDMVFEFGLTVAGRAKVITFNGHLVGNLLTGYLRLSFG